jgi:hypothetical protein
LKKFVPSLDLSRIAQSDSDAVGQVLLGPFAEDLLEQLVVWVASQFINITSDQSLEGFIECLTSGIRAHVTK